MILQFFSFLDANSNEHVALEIIASLIKKKPFKPSEKLKKKLYV